MPEPTIERAVLMSYLRFVVASILMLTLAMPSYPDEAKAAYKRGLRAQSHKQYDAAYESFQRAYALKPKEPKYTTAYLRSRAYAAAQHVANGMKLRDDLELQEALTEFQRAVEIDSTNFVAGQEVRRTAAMLKRQTEPGALAPAPESPLAKLAAEAEGPADLQPYPDNPIVRAEEITDENLRLLDVGTSSSIGLRYRESKPAKSKDSQSPPTAPSAAQSREGRQPKGHADPSTNSPSLGLRAGPPIAKDRLERVVRKLFSSSGILAVPTTDGVRVNPQQGSLRAKVQRGRNRDVSSKPVLSFGEGQFESEIPDRVAELETRFLVTSQPHVPATGREFNESGPGLNPAQRIDAKCPADGISNKPGRLFTP